VLAKTEEGSQGTLISRKAIDRDGQRGVVGNVGLQQWDHVVESESLVDNDG